MRSLASTHIRSRSLSAATEACFSALITDRYESWNVEYFPMRAILQTVVKLSMLTANRRQSSMSGGLLGRVILRLSRYKQRANRGAMEN